MERRDFMIGAGAAACATAALSQHAVAAAQPAERPSSLKITNVETFALQHKLPRAIGPSTLYYGFRDALLVKITTDSGIVGWAETADTGGTRAIIETHLKNVVMGKNPLEHRKLWREIWAPNFGDGRAVAAVDIALHDIRGKALNLSVADMYGGRVRDKALAYAAAMNYTEGVRPEDQYPAEAKKLAAQGFKAMKMRTGRYQPRRDLAVCAAVREAVGPDVFLLTDGNGAFTLHTAIKFGKELEKLDFLFFEEPLPEGQHYPGYKELTRTLDIGIAGGECIDSRGSARQLILDHCFDIIQPDATLCGGIAECLFICEMARLMGMHSTPHCWGGALAIAATLQVLAVLPNATWGFSSEEPMLEFDVYENPFRTEIVRRPFTLDKQGYVAIPTGPGLGVEINEEAVRRYIRK